MLTTARFAALAGAVLLASPALAAVSLVNPAYGPPGSGRYIGVSAGSGTYGVELRGGDSSGAATWEMGVGRRTSTPNAPPVINFNQANINWGCLTTNANAAANLGCGTTQNFTLLWTPTSLSMTIGAITVSSATGSNLAALTGDTVRVRAKRDASFTITSVDGTPFSVSGTGIGSGAPTAGNDYYFHSPNNWGGNGLTMTGTLRIAGGRGSTNQIFFTNGNFVPEPQTWAMLIAGFALVGLAMRRRQAPASVAA